jgi:pyridoxine 5-phosphate synthase
MTRLSVNVNKIALLRNSRTTGIPDVVHLSTLALDAGAQGLTVHPRPDGRHIRRSDLLPLRKLASDRGVEFNIEGNPFHGMLDLAREALPDQCTLVPDDPAAPTSDHGWDLEREASRLRPLIAGIKALGIRVSLFMDPVVTAMAAAKAVGADRVELYTEPYARAFGTSGQESVLGTYSQAARAARSAGLGVNAGHDLNRDNVPRFLQTVPGVDEVSIGHALIADALEFGIGRTVELYLEAIGRTGRQ